MKKYSILIVAILFYASSVIAQNSAVESTQFQTKAEAFINECLYFKTDTYLKMWHGDLNVYAEVVTDIKTGKKIGYLRFETETNATPGSVRSLGYLDLDEISDFLKALNGVVETQKEKKSAQTFSIQYITHGGIDFCFSSGNQEIYFSKEWNFINRFGTPVSCRVFNEGMPVKE